MERRLVGVMELAQYLGVKVNTVYAWVSMRKVPFYKVGKLVKFDQREIDGWVARLRVEPIKEVAL